MFSSSGSDDDDEKPLVAMSNRRRKKVIKAVSDVATSVGPDFGLFETEMTSPGRRGDCGMSWERPKGHLDPVGTAICLNLIPPYPNVI